MKNIIINRSILLEYGATAAIIAGVLYQKNDWVSLDKLSEITGLTRQKIANTINGLLQQDSWFGFFLKKKTLENDRIFNIYFLSDTILETIEKGALDERL